MRFDETQDAGQSFANSRALVVGLAREGTALARFLAERGARVTVTDRKPAETLVDDRAALAGLPVTFALGGHPLELLDGTDIVFVSPGVPLEIPLLDQARMRDLPLSSETRLFTRLCPAPIVGITGSSGKTTTTALAGRMLKTAGVKTWVGGNIGFPLIGHLEEMAATDIVVMELSSFQLEFFGSWAEMPLGHFDGPLYSIEGWSPRVAAVLNVTPNHLDRHGTMEAYTAAKARILDYQRPGDLAVMNLDDPVTRDLATSSAGSGQRKLWFSLEQGVEEGAFLRGDDLVLRLAGREQVLCRTGDLELLGRHNLANLLAASALTIGAITTLQGEAGLDSMPIEALREAATTFEGVEHRLEFVRERRQVRWYNDSIATTPERAVAAIRAFEQPIVLLAGGRDKKLPWEEMAALTWSRVRHLVLFGECADLIDRAMAGTKGPGEPGQTVIHRAGTLSRAVDLAAELAQPGDVVLLSPGGTSFDAYPDFVARGDHFRELVRGLE
jgi:UDP-N-acetylmuramoylalanine--D-glutamate ligase